MSGRPLSVTLLAWLFIVVGAAGILKDVLPLIGPGRAEALHAIESEGALGIALIWTVRALAVVAGAFMLGGRNWARWLLVAWMCFHVAISLFHTPIEALMHVLIFGAVAVVLFRGRASAFFASA